MQLKKKKKPKTETKHTPKALLDCLKFKLIGDQRNQAKIKLLHTYNLMYGIISITTHMFPQKDMSCKVA